MKKAAAAAAVALIIILNNAILPVVSNASAYKNYEKAVDLKILGLLEGSEKGFDLGRASTRLEGAVMLVRLLGKEKDATGAGYTHPFKDVPKWGDAYVGYLYHNNLTLGTGNGDFGSNDPLSALQYTTFVLRALGYDDKNNDFKYKEALDKARQIGLLTASTASSLGSETSFLRDDMVGISYNALNVKLKNSVKTLLDKLAVDEKAVYKPAAAVLGLYTLDLKSELGNIDSYNPASTSYGYTAKNGNDLFLIMRKFMYQNKGQFKVDTRGYKGDVLKDFDSVFHRAYDAVSQVTGVNDFISKWAYSSNGSALSITFTYRYGKEGFDSRRNKVKEAVNKARQVVSSLIGKNMPAFDKEKILHDYIVNNTRYDIKNYESGTLPEDTFTEYGCLVNKTAVCEGYSKAMKLMCDLSSVECMVISGKSFDGTKWEGHAWNLVKIDGDWYQLDVTYDDPVLENGENMLTYSYFNITDAEIAGTNSWTKTDYPVCSSTRYGYYNRNNLIAGNREEFVNLLNKAVAQQKSLIELKVENYTSDGYSDMAKLVFASGTVEKFNYTVNEDLGIIRIYNIKYF